MPAGATKYSTKGTNVLQKSSKETQPLWIALHLLRMTANNGTAQIARSPILTFLTRNLIQQRVLKVLPQPRLIHYLHFPLSPRLQELNYFSQTPSRAQLSRTLRKLHLIMKQQINPKWKKILMHNQPSSPLFRLFPVFQGILVPFLLAHLLRSI